jgi:ketosteroid isomerase-like protein
LGMWSRRDPVTLHGAARADLARGWQDLEPTFRWVAELLGSTPKSDFRFDVEVAEVSEDGQLAYSVGFERFNELVPDGGTKPITVRVTHVYRREDGEWKIVHRHGSALPEDGASASFGTPPPGDIGGR